jgi:hypothetical protein
MEGGIPTGAVATRGCGVRSKPRMVGVSPAGTGDPTRGDFPGAQRQAFAIGGELRPMALAACVSGAVRAGAMPDRDAAERIAERDPGAEMGQPTFPITNVTSRPSAVTREDPPARNVDACRMRRLYPTPSGECNNARSCGESIAKRPVKCGGGKGERFSTRV